MSEEEKKKQNPPQQNLFMPIEWWSDVVKAMDGKIKLISENYGFGSITFEATIIKGRVKDLVFKDKIRVRQQVLKPQDPQNLTQKPKE